MGKVVGEQDLRSPATFSIQIFPENSNCRINLLLNVRGLKLGHLTIFDALFPFLTFSKL